MERISNHFIQEFNALKLWAWFNRLRATVDPFWWPLYPPDHESALD